MAEDLSTRYQNADAFATALLELLGLQGQPVSQLSLSLGHDLAAPIIAAAVLPAEAIDAPPRVLRFRIGDGAPAVTAGLGDALCHAMGLERAGLCRMVLEWSADKLPALALEYELPRIGPDLGLAGAFIRAAGFAAADDGS